MKENIVERNVKSNRSRILKTVLWAILFLFVVSWFYKLVCLLFITIVWRKQIRTWLPYKYSFKIILLLFALCFYWVMPRYRVHTCDRIQLVYQDKQGNAVNPPFFHYLINVFIPEEEVMNLGVWTARLGHSILPYTGGAILRQFKMDDRNGKINNFYRPYWKLNWNGSFMMSGTTSQVGNMIGLPHTQSVYLVKPKHYDADKKYPVVFFCHGGLGNWKLYQGLWKDLKDCIVLSVGTEDWNGFFNARDIERLFTRQIPFLKKLGYKVDEKQLHIIGLSNGGSAVNVAYNGFSRRFKSIVFVSTGIHQSYPVNSKIIMVGGGKDGSSSSIPGAYRQLKAQGSKAAMMWDDKETHFILVNQQDKALHFLNKEMFIR